MKIIDIIGVLNREQPILITGNLEAGFMRTIAGEVPVALLAKRVKKVYSHEYNNEIIIETV